MPATGAVGRFAGGAGGAGLPDIALGLIICGYMCEKKWLYAQGEDNTRALFEGSIASGEGLGY